MCVLSKYLSKDNFTGNMCQKKKITIGNIGFCLYLMYIMWVVLVEWINFIPKFTLNKNIPFGVAEGIAFSVLFLGVISIRKKINIIKEKISLGIFIGVALIWLVGGLVSVYPDGGFDTFNYHLIAQNPKFENYFGEDFGYGNFQVWGFRLCDRMFYYFRYVLGYRLGTILNSLVLSISYVQMYDLLGKFLEDYPVVGKHRLICNKFVWSISILLTLDSIMMFGSYYVDAISIPIGLELLRLLIEEREKKLETSSIGYFAFLCGLWIGTKLTNVVYVLPCVLIFLFLHIRDFKLFDWGVVVILGLCPYVEYIMYNWKCTGNPFFPYYNKIFKSQFYPITNFKDLRWGGESLLEKIFWIVSAVFRPQYRQGEIWDKWNGVLFIGLIGGFVFTIWYLWASLKKKIKLHNKYMILIVFAIGSSLLWSFTTGISRYYLFGKVVWGIVAFCFIVVLIDRFALWGKSFACVTMLAITMCTLFNMKSFFMGKNWSWNMWSFDTFKEQISFVLKDKEIKNSFINEEDIFVLADQMSMGVAELVDDSVYSFNMSYIGNTKLDGEKLLHEKINLANNAYDIHERSFSDIEEYIDKLNLHNIYIKDIKEIESSLGNYELISLENSDGKENTLWTSKENDLTINVSNIEGNCRLNFISGRIFDWPDLDIVFEIVISDGNKERSVGYVDISNQVMDSYKIDLNVHNDDKSVTIRPLYKQSGDRVPNDMIDYIFCLNWSIQY